MVTANSVSGKIEGMDMRWFFFPVVVSVLLPLSVEAACDAKNPYQGCCEKLKLKHATLHEKVLQASSLPKAKGCRTSKYRFEKSKDTSKYRLIQCAAPPYRPGDPLERAHVCGPAILSGAISLNSEDREALRIAKEDPADPAAFAEACAKGWASQCGRRLEKAWGTKLPVAISSRGRPDISTKYNVRGEPDEISYKVHIEGDGPMLAARLGQVFRSEGRKHMGMFEIHMNRRRNAIPASDPRQKLIGKRKDLLPLLNQCLLETKIEELKAGADQVEVFMVDMFNDKEDLSVCADDLEEKETWGGHSFSQAMTRPANDESPESQGRRSWWPFFTQ